MNILRDYNEKWKEHIKKTRLRELIHIPSDVYLFLYHLTIESGIIWTEKNRVQIDHHPIETHYKAMEISVIYEGESYCFYKKYQQEKASWSFSSLSSLAKLTSEHRKSIEKVISTFPFEEMVHQMSMKNT